MNTSSQTIPPTHAVALPNRPLDLKHPVLVMMVCMGNICRSPTAHVVLQAQIKQRGLSHRITVQSRGTHRYYAGDPPDARSQHHAKLRGYAMHDLRSQPLHAVDGMTADWLLMMDDANMAHAKAICTLEDQCKMVKLTHFCQKYPHATQVPDPYAGGEAGFEHVLDLIEDACSGFLDHLVAHQWV